MERIRHSLAETRHFLGRNSRAARILAVLAIVYGTAIYNDRSGVHSEIGTTVNDTSRVFRTAIADGLEAFSWFPYNVSKAIRPESSESGS